MSASTRVRRLRLAAGAATVLALVAISVGPAAAGTGLGALFNLGRTNTFNGATTLTGTTTKALLQVTSKGTGTGVSITTKAGTPPLKVTSSALVVNLNADKLDGKNAADFVPAAGQTLIASAPGGWVPQLDASALRIDRGPGLVQITVASGYVSEDVSLWPDLPAAVGGKAMQLDGFVFCYAASAHNFIGAVEINTVTDTDGATPVRTQAAYDGSLRDDAACRTYTLTTPVALGATTTVNARVVITFDGTANGPINFGRTTWILEPTSTPASVTLP